MEVEGSSSPIGGFEQQKSRSVRGLKRGREEEVFQRVVEERVEKRERGDIRRAPSTPLTVGEKSFCRHFLDLLFQGDIPQLERVASDPGMSRSVALHLLQASGMEKVGVNVLEHLLAASGADSSRMARHLAKWGEASPEMFAALIVMGPPESQAQVAQEVMSCLGQRGGMELVERLHQKLPPHIRPDLEKVRQQLVDLDLLSRELGGLHLGLPDRGKLLS
jgi:hypothetical protein